VVDDILDVTKSTEELGKTAGKDLAQDKATYPKSVGCPSVSPSVSLCPLPPLSSPPLPLLLALTEES